MEIKNHKKLFLKLYKLIYYQIKEHNLFIN